MITTIQACASIGTFLIFVITAFLALRQLRLANRSSQLAGLQAVSSHFNGADFEKWFKFILTELPIKMADRSFRESLGSNPIDRDVHLEIKLADLYEEVGVYAKYGVVSEMPLIEVLRGGPDTAWEALRATVSLYREIWGPSYYRNFEYLANRSRMFYGKLDPKRTSQRPAVT
jgi:hypothetical protein